MTAVSENLGHGLNPNAGSDWIGGGLTMLSEREAVAGSIYSTEPTKLFELPSTKAFEKSLQNKFLRFIPDEQQTAFLAAIKSSATLKDAFDTLVNYDVPQKIMRQTSERSAIMAKNILTDPRKLAYAFVMGGMILTAACATVPDVGSTTTAVSQYDRWGAWFRNEPEAAVTTVASLSGVLGGMGGLIGAIPAHLAAMQPGRVDEHGVPIPPMPIHHALAGVGASGVSEFIENYIKGGSATVGATIFLAGAPVESIKFLGTLFTAGLFLETITEIGVGAFNAMRRI
ncbi:MAG: hypothetical protein M1120_02995 [Patescibacteria group bacterium]|nr:hypothetical protein [Patescibacteria group bacterium]